jgi:hypothetical protein
MIEAVEYEWQTWDMSVQSEFMGQPTSELEAKWGHLWECRIYLDLPRFKSIAKSK